MRGTAIEGVRVAILSLAYVNESNPTIEDDSCDTLYNVVNSGLTENLVNIEIGAVGLHSEVIGLQVGPLK